MKKFSIILAVDNENGIGKDGDLAWKIPEDMKHFKNITSSTKDPQKQNAVVMGRKTWESLPEKYRPLPGRRNCVLSSSYKNIGDLGEQILSFAHLKSCIKHLSKLEDIENIFIIGGAHLYNMVLNEPCLEKAYITRIYHKYHCDVFFDGLPLTFELESRSEMKTYNEIDYEFSVYKRKYSIFEKIKSYIGK